MKWNNKFAGEMPDRGKYEKLMLSEAEQAERADLPLGIGLALSPLWDFPREPYMIFNHMLRLMHVGYTLWDEILEAFEPPKDLHFLDIGCGFGEMKAMIQRYRRPAGYTTSYTGIDGDPIRIDRCGAIYPKELNFFEAMLPAGLEKFSSESFQGLVCSEVYEHLTYDEGVTLLKEAYRITVPKGVAVFTVPCPNNNKHRSHGETGKVDVVHQNEIFPADFIREATLAGWTVSRWFWLRLEPRQDKRSFDNVNRKMWQHVLAPSLPPETVEGQDALYVLRKV